MFRTRGVLATACAHLVDNFSTYSVGARSLSHFRKACILSAAKKLTKQIHAMHTCAGLLAPSIFVETLRVQPGALGKYLALPTALNPLMAVPSLSVT